MFGGRKGPRTFKVVNAVNKDGCPTKFRSGRYTGNPKSAAKKAFTKLCNLKNVRGQCVLYVTVQETTRGSGKVDRNNNNNNNKDKKGKVVKKEKTYRVERYKLPEPVVMFAGTEDEFKRLYGTAKSVDSVPACRVKRPRTRGVMKKTSRRVNKSKAKSKKVAKSNNKSLNSNLANNNNYRNNNQNGGRKKKSMRKKRN